MNSKYIKLCLLDTLNKKRNVPGLDAFADDVDDEPNPKDIGIILAINLKSLQIRLDFFPI